MHQKKWIIPQIKNKKGVNYYLVMDFAYFAVKSVDHFQMAWQ